MQAFARGLLVLVAALAGIVGDLHLDLASFASDACCEAVDCCCAAEAEPACCSAEEDPYRGPKLSASCACGRHGGAAKITVRGPRWTLLTPMEVRAAVATDFVPAPRRSTPVLSRRDRPEVPPPRA